MGFINERDEHGKWRTIDKKRNILFREIRGPNPESGYEFELTYKETKIRFRGNNKGNVHIENGKYTNKANMVWEFYEMYVAEDLKSEGELIKCLIKDALTTYGQAFRKEKAHSVTVEFKL